MPSIPRILRGTWRGILRYRRENIMTHTKNLDDFLHTYVIVKPLNKLGYVWGGEPKYGIDTPDILYIKVAGTDYEVSCDVVEAIVIEDKSHEQTFDNTSGELAS